MEPEPEPEERIFIPHEFYCPITGDLLNEPVSEKAGHTYEKKEILKWLRTKKESPITREYLDESDLSDNFALKRSIDSIRHKLQSDQLKIDSQILDTQLQPYKNTINETTIDQYYHDNKLVVSINTPDIPKRPPIDVVLCIDVSYSMFEEATLKGNKNEKVSHGISVLSLTISAAKTILYSLEDTDNISIVTYSSEARTIVKNQECTAENKSLIVNELENLKPVSNTNMWAGIITSLDILKETSPENKNKGILLLTDGIPNVEPPRGHEEMLKRYFETENFKCMISSYGFGYNLDSELLLNISDISGGDGYSFIPDASILGSVFINGISNLLTTAIYNPLLKINLSQGICFSDGNTSLEINIDSLKYGKSKNLVFDLNMSRSETRDHSRLQSFADISLFLPQKVIHSDTNTNNIPMIQRQLFRMEIIDSINYCISHKKFNDDTFKNQINSLHKRLDEYYRHTGDEYIQNMLYDISGQVKEALNMTSDGEREDWFSRWGIHYLRSLQEAYKKEMCNNFKDRGICNFKTTPFNKLCDTISTIFEAIPPPKPDIIKRYPQGGTRRGQSRNSVESSRPLKSMSVYNNAGGGCCIGTNCVLMGDLTIKEIQHLKKGDQITTHDPNNTNETVISEVECIVFTESYGGEELLSTINYNMIPLSLTVTPYHPVMDKNGNKWVFPIDISPPQLRKCKGVYTLVVRNRFPAIIQGFTYATLGHGITGDVIGHPFFGSDRVINDLKKFNTYEEGFVSLTKENYKRENDIVTGILIN